MLGRVLNNTILYFDELMNTDLPTFLTTPPPPPPDNYFTENYDI